MIVQINERERYVLETSSNDEVNVIKEVYSPAPWSPNEMIWKTHCCINCGATTCALHTIKTLGLDAETERKFLQYAEDLYIELEIENE